MYQLHTEKQQKYFKGVIRLHYEEGYGENRIAGIIPVGHATAARWIAIFAREKGKIKGMANMTKTQGTATVRTDSKDVKALQKKVKEQEAQLLATEVKAEVYDRMIEIAEARFGIPTRKKTWRQAVEDLHAKDHGRYLVRSLCGLFGVSKQAYYQYDEDAALAKAAREEFALQYIREIRQSDPGISGQKLRHMYKTEFGCDFPIGRDRSCQIIDEYGLKVRLRIKFRCCSVNTCNKQVNKISLHKMHNASPLRASTSSASNSGSKAQQADFMLIELVEGSKQYIQYVY